MSESRACAHPGCAGSARKGSDYCCNAHKQAAYRKRNAQPVTDPSVTAVPVTAEQARNICETGDQDGGTVGPVDKRSSSTGDPRDTESGGKTIVTDFPNKVVDPRPIEDQPPYQVDPRESGMERAIAASAKLVADDLRQPSPLEDGKRGIGPDFDNVIHDDPLYDVVATTSDSSSRCFQDSGIPLPGDPGYKGVCLPDANGRWLLDSHRQRLTHAEERMRYAHG